jgi:hypothetical protein
MLRHYTPPLALLVLTALACTLSGGPTATPITLVSPTAGVATSTLPTVPAVPTGLPTVSAVPSPSHVVPTASITPTPAATLPADLTPEAILITSPGQGSRLAGSVLVAGTADSTFENNLVVEVRDVEGTVLSVTPITIAAELGGRGPFAGEITFPAPAVEGPGRVVVYHASARDGHLIHLASVVVTLVPAGSAPSLVAGDEHLETIHIRTPSLLDVVSGGTLHISGFCGPTFEQTLQMVVLDENGAVVGSGFTTIQSDVGEPGTFEGDVSYSVPSEQPGSVQVFATSPMDGSTEHLASVEVILQP